MDLSIIKQAIYDWMTTETGITVAYAEQAEHRPPLAFGTIKFVNPSTRVGSIDETRPDGDDFFLIGQRKSLISLNIYGRGANDKMSSLRDTLDRDDVIQAFYVAGFCVIGDSEIRDLTQMLETKYEERSQMDLSISYTSENDAKLVPIESVELTAENTGTTTTIP